MLEVVVVVQQAAGSGEDSAVVAVEVLDRSARVLSACLERSCDFRGPSAVR